MGSVAINRGAGALSRFLRAAGGAALLWAGYSALIGVGAQALLRGQRPPVGRARHPRRRPQRPSVEAVLRCVPGPAAHTADDLAAPASIDARGPAERIPVSTVGRWRA